MDDAFGEFSKERFPGLVHRLQRMCGNRDTAEDIAIESFARAARHWSVSEPLTPPQRWKWLNNTSQRLLWGWAEGERKQRTLIDRLRQTRPRPRTAPPDADPVVWRNAVHVAGAMERLSVRERQMVVLYYWEDQPVRDIAVLLEIGEGTVKTTLLDARAKLAKWLGLTRRETGDGRGGLAGATLMADQRVDRLLRDTGPLLKRAAWTHENHYEDPGHFEQAWKRVLARYHDLAPGNGTDGSPEQAARP